MFHTYEMIGGKDLWIVESHHHALHAWAIMRRRLSAPPSLITLDHHTDLKHAFLVHCFKMLGAKKADSEFRNFSVSESSKIDFRSDDSVFDAIKNLKYDEHVHAAHLANIIGDAYVSMGSGPVGCSAPGAWATVFHDLCIPPCGRPFHNDTCSKRVADHVIDDKLLLPRILKIEAGLGGAIEDHPFILDIDLDVFATQSAVEPASCNGFYRLIRSSIGISIAMERYCVKDGALPGENINADLLLESVKQHISKAMAGGH